ncbi:HAUS augmin-like complex subunit 3 [Crotalus adamanteus]|uniref:HAUS augmin-like complex subunit 3 n=1 Tax=Crotalus adamanteus TaxID=8729 RepID=A0AAW1BXT1_CROAD
MFTRRRSRTFLMETIDRGTEFVEVLKTIYPKATTLHEKDFDWLFDCPETEQFLEWFCNTVGEENALNPTELETYEKLVISGKPLLEDEALEEVLRTCSQSFRLNGIARLFRLPITNGELDMEDMRLEYLERVQEEAIDQILGQLSHFEMLKLLLMLKKNNLQWTGNKLEGLMTVLKDSESQLQEWQSCFEDSRFSIKQCPRILIDPSDLTTLRLWEMLDKNNKEKQLFRSYETLASRGSRLCQELRMLQIQLATPFPQFLKLESENKALYCLIYDDSNQLMLHAQGLSEPLEQLSVTQAKIYQILMDTLTDLKAKRKSLQIHFKKTERNLYRYFFSNPDHLKKMVRKVEKQALVSSCA